MKNILIILILVLSISTICYGFDNKKYIDSYHVNKYIYDNYGYSDNEYDNATDYFYTLVNKYDTSEDNTSKKYKDFLLYEFDEEHDDFAMYGMDIIREAFRDYLNQINTYNKHNALTGDIKNKFGYTFNSGSKQQIICSDDLISGNIKEEDVDEYENKISRNSIALKNRAVLKATDMLREYKTWDNDDTQGKTMCSLYIGIAELITGGLNNFSYGVKDYWQEYMDMVNYDTLLSDIEFLVGDLYLEYVQDIAVMVKSISNFDDSEASIVDIFNLAYDKNFLKFITMPQGLFNIYNDGIYERVEIKKANEYSILQIYEGNYLDYKNKNLYARYYLDDKAFRGNSRKYPAFHCTNNVYKGDLYLINYEEVTYIINTGEYDGKIKQIEVRSPALFNTAYSINYDSTSTFDIFLAERSKQEKLHGISNMGSFSFQNNILYKVEYNKEPQSPMGDMENIKDERGKLISPSEVFSELNMDDFENDMQRKKELEYLSYLQKYTEKKLLTDPDMLGFYKIKNSPENTIIARAVYIEDNQYKEILFILNNKLKILDKNVTKQIDEFLSIGSNYRTIIIENNGIVYIGFTKYNNQIFTASIQNDKVGYGIFPIYYHRASKTVNNPIDYSKFASITKVVDIDCYNTQDIHEQHICSRRPLITALAYIRKIYYKKIMNSYPENIKTLYDTLYNTDIKEEYKKCSSEDYDCIMNAIMKYEQYFIR